MHETVHLTYKAARRIAVAILGSTVLAIGIVMIIAPGPAFIVIPVGLVILSLEFAWARSWLLAIRRGLSRRQQRALR